MSYTDAVEILENNDKFDFKGTGADLRRSMSATSLSRCVQARCSSPTTQGDQGLLYAFNGGRQDRSRRRLPGPRHQEIISSSQREERIGILEARIKELGMNPRTTGGTATCGGMALPPRRVRPGL